MLVRCKCGIYTTYGMVCTNCRDDIRTYKYSSKNEEEEPVEEEMVPLDELLEAEEGDDE
jgi:hypothetical protein